MTATINDSSLGRLPPENSSPACGGGRVGGRFRASGSGGANAVTRNVRRVQRGGRSLAKVRHAERPSPGPSRKREGGKGAGSHRAGWRHDETLPGVCPASGGLA